MSTHAMNVPLRPGLPRRQSGFSLIEMMIAITLSLLIVLALSTTFVYNSQSRTELERANQQIENGRYANQVLSDDLVLAGYFDRFNVNAAVSGGLAVPPTKPDPCDTALGTYSPLTNLRAAMLLYIQGYDNAGIVINNANPASTCGTLFNDRAANTDMVVIRRVSTCIRGSTDCAAVAGAPYFQASTCAPTIGQIELSALDPTQWFRLDTTIGNLDRSNRVVGGGGACGAAGSAPIRQYVTHIYFVANNNQAGDNIPTLKRVELGAGGTFGAAVPIAEGIQNLQLEYGIDTSVTPDGTPDVYTSNPDTANGCDTSTAPPTPAGCVTANWRNVMAVKVYILARNTQPSRDFQDTKTYALGTGTNVGPFNDNIKRHLYQTVVRLMNPSGRRE